MIDCAHHLTFTVCYQVGTIHLEERFCTGTKVRKGVVGGCHSLGGSTWWLLWLAVEKPCVAFGRLFVFVACRTHLVESSISDTVGSLQRLFAGQRAKSLLMNGCG